jgi:undecaprenyl-diphosphatase
MAYPPYLRVLPIAMCLVAAAWISFEVADSQSPTPGNDLDHRVVKALRDPQNAARMIGPPFIEEAMRDFTALGGYAVLIMTTICFAAFAAVELGRRAFLFFLLTVTGGYALSMFLKQLVQRERPSIVPHLSHVSGSNSFPSTHAAMAVTVFVTIGLLLLPRTHDRHLRRLMIALPLWLATLVGISRVCMGVHYPTDVLAGWSSGLLWTWLAFLIRGRMSPRAHIQ